jgi:hypothetical protein
VGIPGRRPARHDPAGDAGPARARLDEPGPAIPPARIPEARLWEAVAWKLEPWEVAALAALIGPHPAEEALRREAAARAAAGEIARARDEGWRAGWDAASATPDGRVTPGWAAGYLAACATAGGHLAGMDSEKARLDRANYPPDGRLAYLRRRGLLADHALGALYAAWTALCDDDEPGGLALPRRPGPYDDGYWDDEEGGDADGGG